MLTYIKLYWLYPVGFIGGALLGLFLGRLFLGLLLFSNAFNIPMLYRPADEYISLVRRLSDLNEFNRVTSYYLLKDFRKIDVEFLVERYRREDTDYIRRTLIWILGFADDTLSVVRFFEDIYSTAPEGIRYEILRSLKRLNRDSYDRFIKTKHVDDVHLNQETPVKFDRTW